MDHIVGRGQIETEAAGLQADEEQIALAGLKRSDTTRALARPAWRRRDTDSVCRRIERLAQQLRESRRTG